MSGAKPQACLDELCEKPSQRKGLLLNLCHSLKRGICDPPRSEGRGCSADGSPWGHVVDSSEFRRE